MACTEETSLADTMTASGSSHRSPGSSRSPRRERRNSPGKKTPPAANTSTMVAAPAGRRWGAGGQRWARWVLEEGVTEKGDLGVVEEWEQRAIETLEGEGERGDKKIRAEIGSGRGKGKG